jgi:hypothetical protein
MLLAVVVVPKLGCDEDVFALYKSFINGTLDAFSCLLLVLIVVGSIEESVARFDSLQWG